MTTAAHLCCDAVSCTYAADLCAGPSSGQEFSIDVPVGSMPTPPTPHLVSHTGPGTTVDPNQFQPNSVCAIFAADPQGFTLRTDCLVTTPPTGLYAEGTMTILLAPGLARGSGQGFDNLAVCSDLAHCRAPTYITTNATNEQVWGDLWAPAIAADPTLNIQPTPAMPATAVFVLAVALGAASLKMLQKRFLA